MSDPTITPPPDAPSRQQPSTFSARGDAFFAWLVTFAAEVTTVISWVSEKVTEIAASATAASDSATEAAGSASEAVQSALTASGAANYQGDYDAGTFYAVGESVSYTGGVFVKKTAAPAGTTPVDGTDWLELGGGGATKKAVTLTGTSPVMDLGAADYFDLTLTGDTVLAYSNPPSTGEAKEAILKLTGGGVVDELDLASGQYESKSYGFGIAFWASAISDDGSKFYIGQIAGTLHQYSLSTPFDIGTATSDSKTLDVSAQTTGVYSIQFGLSGTKLFVVSNNGVVYQYTLATAWDLSSAVYDSVSFSGNAQTGNQCYGAFLSNDGLKLLLTADSSHAVYQYTLTTAWDISTASYDSVSFSLSAQLVWPLDLALNSAGTRMVVACRTNLKIYQYTLATAFDVSSATYDGVSFDIQGVGGFSGGVAFARNGVKAYQNNSNGTAAQSIVGADQAFTLTYPSGSKFVDGTSPPAPPGALLPETEIIDFLIESDGTSSFITKRGGKFE